jgi:hypothetical protein
MLSTVTDTEDIVMGPALTNGDLVIPYTLLRAFSQLKPIKVYKF